MRIKKISLFALFSLLTFILIFYPSCNRKNDKATNEIHYGFATEPQSLDPLYPGNTADGRSILFNVFEGLVKPDTEGTLQPCIAESWTIDRDELIYSFTLRDGMRFHDGSLLNSADVKFSLETAASAGFDGLTMIKEVTTPDTRHVNVILKSSDPEFLPYLTIGVVKAENNDREKNINGTGPFFIESYKTQQNLVMRKFDDYWQRHLSEPKDIPRLEKITIVFFANSDALIMALRGGSIDGASITGSPASQLDHRYFDLIHSYSAAVQVLALNNAFPPFDDLRVRRAINYGINIQGIIDSAFFGVGEASGSPIIPGLSTYYERSLSYSYAPDTARALLAEAGFGEGHRLTLEITVPSNYIMHVDTAQVIVEQLEKIGIDAKIKLIDWNSWISNVYIDRQYQATIISLDSPNVSPRSFLSRYYSSNSVNFMNFTNAGFDEVYDAVLTEPDNAKRIRLYREAQRIITTNAASVYIQDIIYYKAFRGGAFSGVLNYPLYVVDFSTIYGIQKN